MIQGRFWVAKERGGGRLGVQVALRLPETPVGCREVQMRARGSLTTEKDKGISLQTRETIPERKGRKRTKGGGERRKEEEDSSCIVHRRVVRRGSRGSPRVLSRSVAEKTPSSISCPVA